MNNGDRSSWLMLGMIVVLLFVYNVAFYLYYATGIEPPAAVEFMFTVAFVCGVVWWMKAEAYRRQLQLTYCPGLILGILWPIAVPYYLLKTRGARGLIPLAIFIGSFVVANILGALVYILLVTMSN